MSKSEKPNPFALLIPIFGLVVVVVMLATYQDKPEAKPEPPQPAPIEYRPTPPVIPTPEPEPPKPNPRDIASEPTATLLAEWNQWRHGPAARTEEIQTVYETLLRRGVISRNGDPVSESSGGGRRRGRR